MHLSKGVANVLSRSIPDHSGSPSRRRLPMFWLGAYMTIEGKVFEQCHAHCISKTSFVDLIKRKSRCIVVATKCYIVWPHPTLHTFSVAVKSICSGCSIPTSFLYSIYILLNMFSSGIWMKYLPLDASKNQSINHTIKQQIIHGSHSLLFFVGTIKNNSKRLFEQKSCMGNASHNKIH